MIEKRRQNFEKKLEKWESQRVKEAKAFFKEDLRAYHLQEAEKAFERSVKQDEYNVDALMMLAFIYKCLGRKGNKVGRADFLIEQAKNTPKPSSTRSTKQLSTVAQGLSFELRCTQLLEAMRYTVTQTSPSSDGGIDLEVKDSAPIRGGDVIIQCKDWTTPVGVSVVRDLYGLVVAEGKNKGIVITSGTFTRESSQFTVGKPLELIDGDTLRQLESEYLG